METTGSSAIDTILDAALSLPQLVLDIVAGLGGDLGSTSGIR